MKYALLIYNAPETRFEVSPEPDGAHDEWVAYFTAAREAGVFIAAEGLADVDTATTVRGSGGKILLTDGPFAETKEHLFGFYLIDAPDLDAAIEWASRMPVVRRGAVEIRPLLDTSPAALQFGRAAHRVAE
ncbi:MAG TPA: YciI family protein [Kutzneria sp.]